MLTYAEPVILTALTTAWLPRLVDERAAYALG
jgi:hypothetical protein